MVNNIIDQRVMDIVKLYVGNAAVVNDVWSMHHMRMKRERNIELCRFIDDKTIHQKINDRLVNHQ